MNFSSDTAAPAHPVVLEALASVNHGPAPSYGDDRVMQQLCSLLVRIFETQELDFWITASGTASNALALSCFCPPTHSVVCHQEAHIQADERGAVEFFTGGGRLHLMQGKGAKVDYGQLADYLGAFDPRFVHATPPAVLSLTNLTECGMAYQPDEIAMRAEHAKHFGLSVHLDGARLANALAYTGASPAQMSWKAGVDVLTLGLTKTGAMGCEIVLLFGKATEKARELRARAKRAGHMPPKMRFLAAQAQAMLDDGLWLALAEQANRKARKLADVFTAHGHRLAWPVEGNELFVHIDEHTLCKLQEDGAAFYKWPGGACRFVCSWATTDAEIEALRESMCRAMRQ
jgi:threonine aldolase